MQLAPAVAVPPLLGCGYYYGTWKTWRGIYVPSSGVFQSQNFVRPNGPGEIIAVAEGWVRGSSQGIYLGGSAPLGKPSFLVGRSISSQTVLPNQPTDITLLIYPHTLH